MLSPASCIEKFCFSFHFNPIFEPVFKIAIEIQIVIRKSKYICDNYQLYMFSFSSVITSAILDIEYHRNKEYRQDC